MAQKLTMYLILVSGLDILESNGVAHLGTQTTPHFFGDSLRNGHSSDFTRLRAAEPSVLQHSFFGHVLCHLCGLSQPSVSDHDKDLILPLARRSEDDSRS